MFKQCLTRCFYANSIYHIEAKQRSKKMDIMLDLETMGNGANSAIIAIGAVAFDNTGIHGKFYQQVNLQSCVKAGMEMDTSTVLWWLKQSDAARKAFDENEKALPIGKVLQMFGSFCTDFNLCKMWGNGAAFDNVILSNAYRKCGIIQPWKFWNDACYRTIKNMFPVEEFNRIGVHHNAVDDAETQASHLIEICKQYHIEL